MIFLCSFNAWVLLFQYPEDIFSRGLVGTYIVILAVMLRAVWQCSWRIRELERQSR